MQRSVGRLQIGEFDWLLADRRPSAKSEFTHQASAPKPKLLRFPLPDRLPSSGPRGRDTSVSVRNHLAEQQNPTWQDAIERFWMILGEAKKCDGRMLEVSEFEPHLPQQEDQLSDHKLLVMLSTAVACRRWSGVYPRHTFATGSLHGLLRDKRNRFDAVVMTVMPSSREKEVLYQRRQYALAESLKPKGIGCSREWLSSFTNRTWGHHQLLLKKLRCQPVERIALADGSTLVLVRRD